MAIDHVLKLYSKTIQSSFLHYGFWDDPNLVYLVTASEKLSLKPRRWKFPIAGSFPYLGFFT